MTRHRRSSRSDRHGIALAAATLALALAVGGSPATAQYDREGRYVPSPMGLPADPYARPIPGYAGKPGGTKGTPAWPRAYELKTPPPAPLYRAPPRVWVPPATLPAVVPLTPAQCREGWSAASHVARVEFARRCRRILQLTPN